MFIDFTTPAIQIDPERFPTGLVVQVLAVPEPADRRGLPARAEDGVSGDFGRADPKRIEVWPVKTTQCQRLTYSLTEQRGYVVIEEENYVDFWVRSHFIDNDNNLIRHRHFTVTTVERAEGWVIEIEARDPGQYGPNPSPVLFTLRMPHFNPQAIIGLEDLFAPTKPQEIPEEKPPGKPIWERLDEEG